MNKEIQNILLMKIHDRLYMLIYAYKCWKNIKRTME